MTEPAAQDTEERAPATLRAGFASGRAARWTATDAFVRTTVLALVAVLGAVLAQRPDLLLVGLPFLLITVWSLATRPRLEPSVRTTLGHEELREGHGTPVHVDATLPEGVELFATSVDRRQFQELDPERGGVEVAVHAGETARTARLGLRSLRWGDTRVGPVTTRFLSSWDAFSYGPLETPSVPLWTLPEVTTYRGNAPAPHPEGLVGAHSSRRRGTGVEFSDIRPFATGDRLRHVHWPVSLRTGELHVTTGHAEQDAEILLVVDALHDVGRSDGVDGDASVMDTTVRAAAAVGAYFLGSGDRVGLQVIGTSAQENLRAANGRLQLRRILDTLARIDVGSDRTPEEREVRLRAGTGALVLMFSPVVSAVFLQWAVALTRSGHQVIVVDTLADSAPERDGVLELAWRLRMLERVRELRAVQAQGVRVVPWGGAGSLDVVLQQARRRRTRGGVGR